MTSHEMILLCSSLEGVGTFWLLPTYSGACAKARAVSGVGTRTPTWSRATSKPMSGGWDRPGKCCPSAVVWVCGRVGPRTRAHRAPPPPGLAHDSVAGRWTAADLPRTASGTTPDGGRREADRSWRLPDSSPWLTRPGFCGRVVLFRLKVLCCFDTRDGPPPWCWASGRCVHPTAAPARGPAPRIWPVAAPAPPNRRSGSACRSWRRQRYRPMAGDAILDGCLHRRSPVRGGGGVVHCEYMAGDARFSTRGGGGGGGG